ncbi:MAG: glucose-6-phosphate isomerase [Oscillospiraceae bacterium]|nr:glucose-6-phosphate isomerase [Oscillospiraceae bacterium]
MSIKLTDKYLKDFITEQECNSAEIWNKAKSAYDKIINRTGEGNTFLGWVDLPENYDKDEFARIKIAAEKIKKNSKAVIVVGIGGSYLGARAAIEFIKSPLYNNLKKDTPDIYYLGNSISSDNLTDVLSICENQDFSVIVISKSGTTTEPAIAFRILRGILEKKHGVNAKDRIFVITDKNGDKSKLKALAVLKGYETFIVPDDIGGRYSVLTAVGLLPIAICGADIDAIMSGAAESRKKYLNFNKENDCIKYAVLRNILYEKGKIVEILVSYEPACAMMNEWWKQLFGESEGKDKKGIFPSSVIFSTDLHSLGQFIQDGSRDMFETVINIKEPQNRVIIPKDNEKIDGMDYVDGMSFDEVNHKAMLGTVIAHTDGGTPNIIIDIAKRNEKTFGEIVYFFELACAVSGYILDVNPFDQPGVEAYKKNMFALLGNPKYAKEKEKIEKRI